jgi:hypothetical protein
MSLPAKINTRSTPTPDQNRVSVQSAPAVIENTRDHIQSLPTPDTLPKKLRERFYYTPGLSSFLNRILHLSVISGTSPEDTANEFFNKYSNAIEDGVKYPALKAYSNMITASFSS